MACWYSILATTLVLTQAPNGASHWVSVAQKEGNCVIRDFGDRPDGYRNGAKLWFGNELLLTCSFYSTSRPQNRSTLSAGGMLWSGEDVPRYYGYNVAFFDAEDKLIACDGGSLPDYPPVTTGTSSVTRLMPIPPNVYRYVASYKVAYFESDLPIGQVPWDEQKLLRVTTTNGNTGATTQQSWPAWKSDGELRDVPFRIRAGSRLLPNDASDHWRAETIEGPCKLTRASEFHANKDQSRKLSIAVGDTSKLRADCHFALNDENAIEGWVHFENSSDRLRFGVLNVTFFDSYGNLVSCIHQETATEANAAGPSVTVGGQVQHDAAAYEGMMPMPIPVGLEARVSAYKITLYDSDERLGASVKEVR